MGWITNISFPEGLEQDGTKIRPGMSTQVRWDIGIGEMRIGADGKIKDDVWHGHPFDLSAKEAYQKELANWTGYLDTNMGVLFFKEGQIQHLDLSYEDVGNWPVNNVKDKWNDCENATIYHSLPAEKWGDIDSVLNLYRATLLSTDAINEDEPGGYALTIARKTYVERSGELVDPYYKAPTPNGFIHA
jgi:hypothetical protein